jgi:hypothetical protein
MTKSCGVRGCTERLRRPGGKGPWPKWCEAHKKEHLLDRQRAAYARKRSSRPAPTFKCVDCGKPVVRKGRRGAPPKRCDPCRLKDQVERDRARGRLVPAPTCKVEGCGETVTRPTGKGRWPTKCAKHAPPTRAGKNVAPAVVICREEGCSNSFPRTPGQRGSIRCDECKNAMRRAAYRTKIERDGEAHRERERWYRMWSKFGLKRQDYERLLAKQNGVCASCGASPEGERYGTLSVDHDRKCCPGDKSCGKCIRGLLCNDDNISAGRMKDSSARLRSLADYLDYLDARQEVAPL